MVLMKKTNLKFKKETYLNMYLSNYKFSLSGQVLF